MPALSPADLELLSAYLDDELTPAERAALERRLHEEADLRAELEALRQVVALTRQVSPLRAPRDYRLDPAVYGRRRAGTARRVYGWASALSAVAALLLLALGAWGLLQGYAPAPNNLALQEAAEPAAEQPTEVAAAPTLPPAPALRATATTAQAMAGDDSVTGAAEMPAAQPSATAQPGPTGEGAALAAGMPDTAQAAAPPEAEQQEEALDQAGEAQFGPPPPSAQTLGETTQEEEAAPALAMPESGGAAPPTVAPGEADAAPETGMEAAGRSEATSAPGFAAQPPAPTPSPQPTLAPPTATATATATPSATPQPTPQAEARATPSPARSDAPYPVEPGLLIGAGAVLLALAGALLALRRRA